MSDIKKDDGYEKYLYPTYDDENFNAKIFHKKEFNDLVVNNTEQITSSEAFIQMCNQSSNDNESTFKLSNYQRFVRNYLSFQTPYNSLLLYHGLGTGKTCSAILIAEEMREYIRLLGMPTKQSIYIVSNDNVQKNFKAQLFNKEKIVWNNDKLTMTTCIGDKIIKEFFDHLNKPNNYQNTEEKKNIVKEFIKYYENNIEPAYHFITYGKIPTTHYESYANKLFIIDEVHNIKDNSASVEKTHINGQKKLKKNLMYEIKIDDTPVNARYVGMGMGKGMGKERTYQFMLHDNTIKELYLSNVIIPDPTSHYERLTKFINNVDNLKLLFLSATPMFDNEDEIKTIINLMRMNDNRAIIQPNEIITENNIAHYARGYVSFVPGGNPYTFPFRLYPQQFASKCSSKNKVKFGYRQDDVGSKLDLYMVKMSKEQHDTYTGIANKLHEDDDDDDDDEEDDISTGVIENNELKLSVKDFSTFTRSLIMTYPDNKYGDDGFKSVCTKNTNSTNITYTMKEGHKKFFGISSLQKYGCKLHAIMEQLKNTNDGIILVYSRFIIGALIPLALALETAGYIRTTDGDTPNPYLTKDKSTSTGEKMPMYAIFTGAEEKKGTEELMRQIKSPENCKGKNIKIVLISAAASEGIDFKNIRQVHILNPWYNMSRIEQTIGRAVRTRSHQNLDFEQRNVEIYMHCAYYETSREDQESSFEQTTSIRNNQNDKNTYDYIAYTTAFNKATKIGQISRELKNNSIDCLVNKDDNNILYKDDKIDVSQMPFSTKKTIEVAVTDMPYSMNCDYMEKCKPIECNTQISSTQPIDKSTFNETFIFMNNDEIISKIQELFQYRTYYTKLEIYNEIRSIFNYSDEQIAVSLTEMIDNKYKYYLYNKVADETGYLVNIGDYYMFQPTDLTYPKIGEYERRTNIPIGKISVDSTKINQLQTGEEIKKLIEKFRNDDRISKILNNNETITNINDVTSIVNQYNDDNNREFKEKVNFLLEYLKICIKIEEIITNITHTDQSTETNISKQNIGKKKSKENQTDKKSKVKKTDIKKVKTFEEFVIQKIRTGPANDDTEPELSENISKMKKTIIQNYIDSLSYSSQLSLIMYWRWYQYQKNGNDTVQNNDNNITEYIDYIDPVK